MAKGGDGEILKIKNEEKYEDLESTFSARDLSIYNFEKQPREIKSRVNALRNLQYEAFKLESQFYKDLNQLELKYEASYIELNRKRREIYLGQIDPTKDQCVWLFSSKTEDMDDITHKMVNKLALKERTSVDSADRYLADGDQDIKGIPNFWFTIFKNVPILSEKLEEYDWPIIKNLIDISCVMVNDIGPGFRLDFTFAPNEYFTNSVLFRIFYVNFELPTDNPLTFEGPEIVMSKGCKIDWKNNKNVTIKNIKQMKKSRVKGEKRSFTKTCKTNSFFNFFENIVTRNDSKSSEDNELMNQIDSDFEIGQYLRERIIPRAVLFYTGEGIDEDEDEMEDECTESSAESESESTSSIGEVVNTSRSRPLLRK